MNRVIKWQVDYFIEMIKKRKRGKNDKTNSKN